jgi:poly(A) polymerase/tRNA nucleotidyltransferase (CCA-adding enzyme)
MKIPKEIKNIIDKLERKDFQVYLVGGCVRDMIQLKKPKDWDIATNANPKEISKIFPKSFSNNDFGTVTLPNNIEITPFRTEEKYTDKRHPDKVEWAKTIEEDLSRRDFTVNAMAFNKEIIDPYKGLDDLKKGIIKAVLNPEARFSEDALRMMRAVRFATVLGFKIEAKTSQAIKKNSVWLQSISKERVRDEFLKIIMSERANEGIELLRKLNLLKYIISELEEGYGIKQNKHHIYGCYEHSIFSLRYAAKENFNLHVRLASLFHDIGKPRSKRGEGANATFYGHEVIGARMTAQIMERLRFSKKDIEKVVKLVRYHLFYYNVDEVTESSVRRLVRKVGPESVEELLEVRMADRIGSGCPKAEPYKLRHLKYIIEKVSKDPISTKMLKINGKDIMDILEIKPGLRIGLILDILLGYVLTDPKKNNKIFLEKEIKKLGKLSDKELSSLADKAKEERDVIEIKEDKMTKDKYWVT